MLWCNFVIIHYYIYNSQFCSEFTYQKKSVNKITVTKK